MKSFHLLLDKERKRKDGSGRYRNLKLGSMLKTPSNKNGFYRWCRLRKGTGEGLGTGRMYFSTSDPREGTRTRPEIPIEVLSLYHLLRDELKVLIQPFLIPGER